LPTTSEGTATSKKNLPSNKSIQSGYGFGGPGTNYPRQLTQLNKKLSGNLGPIDTHVQGMTEIDGESNQLKGENIKQRSQQRASSYITQPSYPMQGSDSAKEGHQFQNPIDLNLNNQGPPQLQPPISIP
jgi:hypothetical protein